MLTNNFWETITPSVLIEKATGYLPIPGIFIKSLEDEVPYVVAQFLYQCPNNFCIPAIPPEGTLGQGFNLAIRYNDSITDDVIRYKFWNYSDDAMYDIPAPLYDGQMIQGTNFVIEVWSLGGSVVDMPFGCLLATTVKQTIQSLTDPTSFQLGTVSQCTSLNSINGLNMPLTFLPCATAQYTGQQTGTLVSITGQVTISSIPMQGANYRFNQTTGALEILNLDTSKYNSPYTQGVTGSESLVLEPQD